jgi:hypothetical protein
VRGRICGKPEDLSNFLSQKLNLKRIILYPG